MYDDQADEDRCSCQNKTPIDGEEKKVAGRIGLPRGRRRRQAGKERERKGRKGE